jgi:hypothetical protein
MKNVIWNTTIYNNPFINYTLHPDGFKKKVNLFHEEIYLEIVLLSTYKFQTLNSKK